MPATRHEQEKEEHWGIEGVFIPLVLSSTEGCGSSVMIALKRVTCLFADKHVQPSTAKHSAIPDVHRIGNAIDHLNCVV